MKRPAESARLRCARAAKDPARIRCPIARVEVSVEDLGVEVDPAGPFDSSEAQLDADLRKELRVVVVTGKHAASRQDRPNIDHRDHDSVEATDLRYAKMLAARAT